MVVSATEEENIRNGRPLVLEDSDSDESPSTERCRAYALDGSFLGVLRFNAEKRQWQPDKVFV